MSSNNILSKTFTEVGEFTPIPNWILDEIVSDQTIHSSVVRVFLYLFRETVGWNDGVKNISLKHIQNGAGVSRERAIYATRVICECWGLFLKIRGQQNRDISSYKLAGHPHQNERVTMQRTFETRAMVLRQAYGTICPTKAQMKKIAPEDAINMTYDQLRPHLVS